MKNIFKLLTVAAVVICFAFTMPVKERKVFTVAIEAAHGGKDYGAVYGELKEKDIVRQLAKKVTALNTDTDVVFHVINGDDDFLDLQDRVKAINSLKADLVISLHVNAERNGEDASGMEFFVTDKPEHAAKSTELAGKLSSKFKSDSKFNVRKVAQAPFYILKNVDAPAVMFHIGFLTNEHDRAYMTDEETQKLIANKIVDFVKEVKQ